MAFLHLPLRKPDYFLFLLLCGSQTWGLGTEEGHVLQASAEPGPVAAASWGWILEGRGEPYPGQSGLGEGAPEEAVRFENDL